MWDYDWIDLQHIYLLWIMIALPSVSNKAVLVYKMFIVYKFYWMLMVYNMLSDF